MELKFVDKLPKQATGRRSNAMRIQVLEELVEALAGNAGDWAIYPWQLVRPDLAGLDENDKKVASHIRSIQQMCKAGEEPFDDYMFEMTVRRRIPFIRVILPEPPVRSRH